MNNKKPINAYRTTQANTASRGTLLLMMYEGAIRFIRLAIAANEQGKHDEKLEKIKRARAIVQELQRTLDYEKGGSLAFQLDRLYGFVNNRLMRGSIEKEPKVLEEAIEVLQTLLGGWREAVQNFEHSDKAVQKTNK
ncbi:MAG: flagellar export chaperone FliS [Bdellovibrionaceae bacterium]|nr:flagellar export chaperone FliS [Bdellovibrionales bacterium]MCB9255288.1 flagellar export chaperone FliS [Pseudobdellovibrionaceae bacterium]